MGISFHFLGQRPPGFSGFSISLSADGRFQKRVMGFLGIEAVDGSSSRGGYKAARQLLRCVRGDRLALIAADGPRGPRHKANPASHT